MSNSKVTLRIGIGTLILLCYAFTSAYSREEDSRQNSGPNPIYYTQGSEVVSLDAVFDSSGSIHLLYSTTDKGIFYQRSSDKGQSWSTPQMLAANLPGIYSDDSIQYILIKIVSIGAALYAFWNSNSDLIQCSSMDNGISWNSPSAVISAEDMGMFSLIADYDVIYIAYHGKVNASLGTYFRKSADGGLTWSSPVKIDARDSSQRLAVYSGIALNQNCVYVVGTDLRSHIKGKPYPSLIYIRSENLGDSWDAAREIDVSQISKHSVYVKNQQIALSGNTVWIAFNSNDVLYFMVSTNNGDSWSRPEALSKTARFTISITARGNNQAAILWIDGRNANHPFWADIPIVNGVIAFINQGSPYWKNNDIYCSFLDGNTKVKTERLTPDLSYALDHAIDAMACGTMGDSLLCLWPGIKKVGIDLDTFHNPHEVFYEFVNWPIKK